PSRVRLERTGGRRPIDARNGRLTLPRFGLRALEREIGRGGRRGDRGERGDGAKESPRRGPAIDVWNFVRPVRFERTTHGFEGHCSIQLSYGRETRGPARTTRRAWTPAVTDE